MATFFVGQRVRIKWSISWPELAGEQGIIVGRTPNSGPIGASEWLVAPDRWGKEFAPEGVAHSPDRFGPSSDQLEPIQPEGHKAVEWNACLWRPEHLREVA